GRMAGAGARWGRRVLCRVGGPRLLRPPRRSFPGIACRMTDRKKPGAAFWATLVVVVVLLAYPLSLGPAIWLAARGCFRDSTVQSFYMPVLWSAVQAESLDAAITWWGSLGVPDGKAVTFIFETDEATVVFQFTRTGEEIPLH